MQPPATLSAVTHSTWDYTQTSLFTSNILTKVSAVAGDMFRRGLTFAAKAFLLTSVAQSASHTYTISTSPRLALPLFGATLAFAETTFLENVDVTDDEINSAMAVDTDGVIFAVGETGGVFSLTKRSPKDGLEWIQTCNEWQQASALTITPNGSIGIAGVKGDGALIGKLSPDGEIQWFDNFGRQNTTWGYGIVTTQHGGLVGSGLFRTQAMFFLGKWTDEGNRDWLKKITFAKPPSIQFQSLPLLPALIVTPDDGFLVGGELNGRALVCKLDAGGEAVWARAIAGLEDSKVTALANAPGGKIALVGWTNQDTLISTLTSTGDILWIHVLGNVTSGDYGTALAVNSKGDLFISGYINSLKRNGLAFVLRLNANGALTWLKGLDIESENYAYALSVDPSGEITITGVTVVRDDLGSGKGDFLFLQLTERGELNDCTLMQPIHLTYVDVNASAYTTSLNVSSADWLDADSVTMSNLTSNFVNFTVLQDCLPVASSKQGNSHHASTLPAWVLPSIIGGGACLLLGGLGALSCFLVRRRRTPTQTNAPIELTPPQPPIRKDAGRTEINGQYILVRKITREEASALFEQTGIEIEFPKEGSKAKPLIGAGRFGKLRIAQLKSNNKFVGVKKIKGPDEIAASQQEAALQRQLSKLSNLMPLLDSFETVGSDGLPVLYQFMPLAGFGNGEALQATLSKPISIDIKRKVVGHVAHSILTGLSGMHSKGIAHLDLKNSNIVLTLDGKVLIIDFGCAKQAEDLALLTEGNGDSKYFSPSRMAYYRGLLNVGDEKTLPREDHYSGTAADFWALGILLLELMNSTSPLKEVPFMEKLQTWDLEMIYTQLEPALSNPDFAPLADLIRKLLADSGKIAATELLKDPVFTDPAYIFADASERSATFKGLKVPADISPSPAPDDLVEPVIKRYVRHHYVNENMPHTYVNAQQGNPYVNA